jgi:hypothetical protein
MVAMARAVRRWLMVAPSSNPMLQSYIR